MVVQRLTISGIWSIHTGQRRQRRLSSQRREKPRRSIRAFVGGTGAPKLLRTRSERRAWRCLRGSASCRRECQRSSTRNAQSDARGAKQSSSVRERCAAPMSGPKPVYRHRCAPSPCAFNIWNDRWDFRACAASLQDCGTLQMRQSRRCVISLLRSWAR